MKYFELIQESDETLFVPSRWYHQVKNIDDAVSVNHNWFNGCNIESIVENIVNHHQDVQKEISDCKDMDNFKEHCQLMLKSSFGMNLYDLVEILTHVGQKRINLIKNGVEIKIFDEFTLGTNHALNDLKIILKMLVKLEQNSSFKELENLIVLITDNINKIKELNNKE